MKATNVHMDAAPDSNAAIAARSAIRRGICVKAAQGPPRARLVFPASIALERPRPAGAPPVAGATFEVVAVRAPQQLFTCFFLGGFGKGPLLQAKQRSAVRTCFFLRRGLMHSKGARTAAASAPLGPRARRL
jgi:hypothetical protein